MLTCPQHREVVLEKTAGGMLCFLCHGVVEPIEVADPANKVLGFRICVRPPQGERPQREGTYDEPIDDGLVDRAIDALRDALRNEPGNRELKIQLAELLQKNGNTSEAAAAFLDLADGYVADGFTL